MRAFNNNNTKKQFTNLQPATEHLGCLRTRWLSWIQLTSFTMVLYFFF